jgi:gamma-glutamyltranspeptidase/glutathione hydrolase
MPKRIKTRGWVWKSTGFFVVLILSCNGLSLSRSEKPVLHGRHWVAITGKPIGATAGAMIFQKGGNAVDAACAMLGAVCTMYDVLSWGGETQALIYNPHTKEVRGINALGVAPTGATSDFYKEKDLDFPPEDGPLSAVTPGTPGGLFTMLAEFGTLSLKEVLEPSIQMADGYPMEEDTVNRIEERKDRLKLWPYSKSLFLPHLGEEHEGPHIGEIFRQPDLKMTLEKLVEAEQQALAQGKTRKQAIYAAYDRFYKGDIAEELVRSCQEQGGLITMQDLAEWKCYIEDPVMTTYKGIDVYKLTCWVQGPVLLQMLNMLEQVDLKKLGYNSVNYIHTLYQVMNHCFADRDFYYGDPYVPPEEPLKGLLSKEYAQQRFKQIDWNVNDTDVRPGDPYPFENKTNPYQEYLKNWTNLPGPPEKKLSPQEWEALQESFWMGTTSIQAADKEGWVVSVTPSGAWIPPVIAGKTGVALSQRAQSFVVDPAANPFNVVRPGQRPRATLTPGMALKDGRPYLSFAVQGGDTQDQNLLQFFLNMVEFNMNVQEACEAANITSYQMRSSFGLHKVEPGRLSLHKSIPQIDRDVLEDMGYIVEVQDKTSGPITAVFFDWKHRSFWGGASNYGDDHGIVW